MPLRECAQCGQMVGRPGSSAHLDSARHKRLARVKLIDLRVQQNRQNGRAASVEPGGAPSRAGGTTRRRERDSDSTLVDSSDKSLESLLAVSALELARECGRSDAPFSACASVDSCSEGHKEPGEEDSDSSLPSIEIGSGVCVAQRGNALFVLTAGHAAVSEAELRVAFLDGVARRARCVARSDRYDLALLRLEADVDLDSAIVDSEVDQRGRAKKRARVGTAASAKSNSDASGVPTSRYGCCQRATCTPELPAAVLCIGQPGRPRGRRLEAVSGQAYRVADNDPKQEQLELGALEHTCPVFAGNSGSPLFSADTGELVGLHTGHDHRKHTSHAVTIEAINEFLGTPLTTRQLGSS
jgi:Trypsin-like peptidase domain